MRLSQSGTMFLLKRKSVAPDRAAEGIIFEIFGNVVNSRESNHVPLFSAGEMLTSDYKSVLSFFQREILRNIKHPVK